MDKIVYAVEDTADMETRSRQPGQRTVFKKGKEVKLPMPKEDKPKEQK
jgi:hypothetical protein